MKLHALPEGAILKFSEPEMFRGAWMTHGDYRVLNRHMYMKGEGFWDFGKKNIFFKLGKCYTIRDEEALSSPGIFFSP